MYIEKEYSVYYICLSYVSAVLGSYVSITLVDEVRLAEKKNQFYFWVSCAAFAIGGAGIWTMHFIGMQSLSLGAGRLVVYDVGLTILSIFVSVMVPWLALYFVAMSLNPAALGKAKAKLSRKALAVRIALSGTCCGIGIGGMHYTGMSAMTVENAHAEFNAGIVVASVLIAIIASTVALWIMFFLRGIPQRIIVSFVMGIAVTGMHFTGMAAVNYVDDPTKPLPNPLPMRYVFGGSLGLYADVVASILRFLLLGLVYASEFMRGRQMESYYIKARGKLVEYDPLCADELPLPRSTFSRRKEKDTTFSKIRYILSEVFGFADPEADYDFSAANSPNDIRSEKIQNYEKEDSSFPASGVTTARTEDSSNLSRMTSYSSTKPPSQGYRNPLRSATNLMLPPVYDEDVPDTVIITDTYPDPYPTVITSSYPDPDPPVNFEPPPFTRRNSITNNGDLVATPPTPIFRTSTGSFRNTSITPPSASHIRTSTGSMQPVDGIPPSFSASNSRRHSNAEANSNTTSSFKTSGSFKNSSSTPAFKSSTGSFNRRNSGSSGSLPAFDIPPGFSPSKRRNSNGSILHVSNLSVEIVVEEKPEELEAVPEENLTLNTLPSQKNLQD